jgi:hypothetical protein
MRFLRGSTSDEHDMVFPDAAATAGKTPMVELGRLARGPPRRVVAK